MKEPEMQEIGRMIAAIVREPQSEDVRTQVQRSVPNSRRSFRCMRNG
jgi:glycine/serine hydroxymethyltransferase